MKVALTAFVIIIIVTCLQSQEVKFFWDGFDWQKIDSITIEYPEYAYWIKSAYLSGLLDGKHFYGFQVMEKDQELYHEIYKDLLQPGKFKDYIQALDQFYQQQSNLYLPLPSALIAVKMSAIGYPRKEIELYILKSKIWVNNLMKQAQKSN